MTDPIPRSYVSAGLRRLADLVDVGLLDEREFPEVRQPVQIILETPDAVERFAELLGVETLTDDFGTGRLHTWAAVDLDGVTVRGTSIVKV